MKVYFMPCSASEKEVEPVAKDRSGKWLHVGGLQEAQEKGEFLLSIPEADEKMDLSVPLASSRTSHFLILLQGKRFSLQSKFLILSTVCLLLTQVTECLPFPEHPWAKFARK